VNVKDVSCLRQLVADMSLWRPVFDSSPVCVGLIVKSGTVKGFPMSASVVAFPFHATHMPD
jgi:hypothetical protein